MTHPKQRMLDSHIHLWPQTATSSTDHGWMQQGHFLAKRHGISDYISVARPEPTGFLYVETDRHLPSPAPSDISSSSSSSSSAATKERLAKWAHQPLEEVKFLRRIVECTPRDGDGFGTAQQAAKMKGCIIYAPFHLAPAVFQAYLGLAEEAAGPALWTKVVGFRCLLQGHGQGVVERLLQRDDKPSWLANLAALRHGRAGRGWCFDVGVDVHRDGYAPLEAVGMLIKKVREKEGREGVEEGKGVRFVLNHLAKHPLNPCSPTPNPRWLSALSAFSPDPLIFIKLSGALNEFTDTTPDDPSTLLATLTPLLDHVFRCFPNRVMFGSDWPVCNVGGPRGEAGNWALWRRFVEAYLEVKGVRGEEREGVWWRVATEAYGIDF